MRTFQFIYFEVRPSTRHKINSNPTPTGYIQDVYIWQARSVCTCLSFVSEIGRFRNKDKQKRFVNMSLPGTLFYPTLLQRYAIFANSKRPRVAKTKIYFSGLNFQKLTVERFADWKTLWANPRAGKQEHKGLRCVVRELSGSCPGADRGQTGVFAYIMSICRLYLPYRRIGMI